VVAKDLTRNVLIAGQGHEHPLLMSKGLVASQLHWTSGSAPALPMSCQARIRHRQPLQACRLQLIDEARLQVGFADPQRAVTPGQSVVFYQDDICLGGGIIATAFR
jgi:tRNA-specific 2-thiouridylase